MPYTLNDKGHGPSWGNSLFEDNAEHGLGMHLGVKQIRSRVIANVKALIEAAPDADLTAAAQTWLDNRDNGETTRATSDAFEAALKAYKGEAQKDLVATLVKDADYLVKRSTWIIGGDGWAYDIGYGGLDHVLATGENVNVLVLDTEVYSNTGGQASKSTPTGAIAQFAAGGKPIKKKDLGMMAMSYGYVYVAQVAMGASQNQVLKAMLEAEAYDGPSLIIAYSPCINHGIRGGLTISQRREKEAVDSGYWHLYRFNPLLKEEGKNPFTLDSKEPAGSYTDFLRAEVRYNSLFQKYPAEHVEEIFEHAVKASKERYASYKRLADNA